jgi:putative transcriptional regulator
VRWNLRLAAAQRDIWKASELHRMLAGAWLVISAGKISNLWSGQPVTIRLDDPGVICEVLGCEPGDLLVREPGKICRDQREDDDAQAAAAAAAAGGGPVIRRRHAGRFRAARVSAHAPPGDRRRRPRASRLRSCDHCLAWGVLTERLGKACRSFASTRQGHAAHPAGTCRWMRACAVPAASKHWQNNATVEGT